MDILYPRLRLRQIGLMFGSALFGALVGGVYGALHDQISFTISPEYFTKMKFQQFADANFGFPVRVFVAEVGFLASWWVGMIAGWILGRVGFGYGVDKDAERRVLKAFGILIGGAALCGAVGILLGIYWTRGVGLADWIDWREELHLEHLREFAIVAYLHDASYLGSIVGLIGAIFYLVRCKPTEAPV